MRKLMGLVGVLVLLAGLPACDTTQPVDSGEQILSIRALAQTTTGSYNVYDVYEDTNGNGVFDAGVDQPAPGLFPYCTPAAEVFSAPVPWQYFAEATIIRAGSTTEEPLAQTLGGDEYTDMSLTPYPEGALQIITPGSSGYLADPPGMFVRNQRKLSEFDRLVLVECLDKAEYEDQDPTLIEEKDPRILGQFPSFDVPVRQGDTVIFRARKDTSPPFGLTITEPVFSGTLLLDGREVDSSSGDAVSSTDAGAGISISFTVR